MSRRYTDAEVRALVRAATERQEAERLAADADARGLSLDEVEYLAADLGLRPEHLRAAARDLDARPERRGEASAPRLLGLPTRYRASRYFPEPLTDDAWAAIVGDLREAFRTDGVAGQVGRVREWTARGHRQGRQAPRVTAVPEAGGTRLALEQDVRDGVLGTSIAGGMSIALALIFAVLALTGLAPGVLLSSGLIAVYTATFLGITQVGYRLYEGMQTRIFEAVLDRAEVRARQFAEASPEPSPEAFGRTTALAEASTPGRGLDLDALGDPEALDEAPAPPRRRARS